VQLFLSNTDVCFIDEALPESHWGLVFLTHGVHEIVHLTQQGAVFMFELTVNFLIYYWC